MYSRHEVQPIEHNVNAVATILPQVEALLALHREGMQTLSRAFGRHMNRPDECVLLLGSHAHNLNETLIRLILAGRFDVATYLMRPAWDIGGLILAVGSDEGMAERFWSGGLTAGEARAEMVTTVRRLSGDGPADEIEAGWRTEYGPLQGLSHVSLHQLDKLVTASASGIRPVLGGLPDEHEAIVMLRGAIKASVQAVVHLYAVRGKVLGVGFQERLLSIQDGLVTWVGGQPDGTRGSEK